MKLRTILLLLSLLAFLAAIAGGYSYHSSVKGNAFKEAEMLAASHTEDMENLVSLILANNLKAVKALSGLQELGRVLEKPDESALALANSILDQFNDSLDADVTYLMDRQGTTILSSNRNDPDSFVGQNYSFRPYFEKAMQGFADVYMALGVTSRKRGVYYSHPVHLPDQKAPAGVIVIKTSIEMIEKVFVSQDHHEAGTITLISGPLGVVFISDSEQFLYQLLWKIPAEELTEISKSKQFGNGPWQWTGFEREGKDRAIDHAGNKYLMHQAEIGSMPGWNIVHLTNLSALSKHLYNPFIDAIDAITLFLIFLIGVSVSILYTMGKINITRQVQTEKALRESEARYRRLTENAQDVIWRTDTQGKILFVNAAVENLLGYSPEDVIGFELENYMVQDSIGRVAVEANIALAEQQPRSHFRLEVDYIAKDGKTMPFEMVVVILFNETGGVSGYEGISRDISEKIRTEKELRQAHKMEAIGTLAGGIAHEFNNILGIVLGNAELALDDTPEWKPTHGFLKEIRVASLRGKDVVKQLLSFSRKADQKKQPLKMSSVVKESMGLLRATIPANVVFEQNVAADAHTIMGDQIQIHQVLINLCTNAAHAMEEHGGRLKIIIDNVVLEEQEPFFDQLLKPGEYVRLAVCDTGHGIQPDTLERIFDPFYTTKEVGKGSGMGLAVVLGIMKGHDGGIRISSSFGQGTDVECYFPAVEAKLDDETGPQQALPGGSETILFVDDEESLARMGKQGLERLGYRVLTSTDPIEALELFRENPEGFDLVITDMSMPQMAGDRFIQELFTIRPDVKTIICTGFSHKIDGEKALRIGASAFIMKPVERENLARTVRQVLEVRGS